ncbi:MAG TPA: hypothetical protein VMV19_11180 [Xanthobacteraceae bacterium]|nr:hypothetical protein [Xanthobacteraceae bacterium]
MLLPTSGEQPVARLWQRQGKHAKAFNILAPVLDRFTEGLEKSDVAEARSVLQSPA